MSAALELEYLKGPTEHAGVRAKKRLVTRSERRQVKMALAGAIVARVAYERFDEQDVPYDEPPIFYDRDLDIYIQFDREIQDFVEVPWYKAFATKDSTAVDKNDVVAFVDEHFEDYVHLRYDNKGGDNSKDSCRMNTVCRWLRSMAGKPWNDVNAELIARFNGKGKFLWSRNVYEFCHKVECDAFPEFFVDESGTFRCRQTKFHNYDAQDKPAPKRKNLSERLAAKEVNEREIKEVLHKKRFMISNRRMKRQWKSLAA